MILPVGTIILWHTGAIPSGWKLCDGNNDTPDLRGFFIKGAANSGDLLDSGGVETHTHTNPNTGNSVTHTHTLSGSTGYPDRIANYSGTDSPFSYERHTHTFSGTSGAGGAHAHSIGASNSANNVPPYIKLYYIMRIT